MSDFKWCHCRGDVILWAVRWCCKYGISYRNLAEMLTEAVQDGLLVMAELLALGGPALGRPHASMKELRFSADGGVWRVAFAFDPQWRALVLVAGDKAGVPQSGFTTD
jgi:hypothetical protein